MGIMETYKLTNSFPDVHIVGGGLHGAAASVDGIGLGCVKRYIAITSAIPVLE